MSTIDKKQLLIKYKTEIYSAGNLVVLLHQPIVLVGWRGGWVGGGLGVGSKMGRTCIAQPTLHLTLNHPIICSQTCSSTNTA